MLFSQSFSQVFLHYVLLLLPVGLGDFCCLILSKMCHWNYFTLIFLPLTTFYVHTVINQIAFIIFLAHSLAFSVINLHLIRSQVAFSIQP